MKTKLKKYGKWAFIAFIAYQIIGLIVAILIFDTIILEAETIANNIIGETK
jgi:hypothetical protein